MLTQWQEYAALGLALIFFAFLYYLQKKDVDFGIRALLATGLGAAVGLIFKGYYTYVALPGQMFTRLIGAVVIPMLFFSILSSLTSLGKMRSVKKIGLKSVGFLTLNTLIASIITVVLALAIGLGRGSTLLPEAGAEAREVPTLAQALLDLVPNNFFSHAASNQVIPVVIFTTILAIGLNYLLKESPEKAQPVKAFVDSANALMGKVISLVIEFTPYAVLSLIARAFSRTEVSAMLPLLSALVLSYVMAAIMIFLVFPAKIALIARLNPIRFLKGIWPAGAVAATSQSSIGTLPVNIKQLTQKLGVNGDIAAFTAGLGTSIGMPGCAGYWPTLLAVFAINALGIPYSLSQYAILILITVAVSIGTAGVPGTATITATAVFAAAGLPIEFIVLFTPISTIADMARTATNVIAAAEATVLTAATEGEIDLAVYNGEAEGDENGQRVLAGERT